MVLYFFPEAVTTGCSIEAHAFADAMDKFKAQGATVIGVTAGNIDQLSKFSTDTRYCSGKFPLVADDGAAIAKTYDSTLSFGTKTVSSRTSYVIAPDDTVLLSYTDMAAGEAHRPDPGRGDEVAGGAQGVKARHPTKSGTGGRKCPGRGGRDQPSVRLRCRTLRALRVLHRPSW